MFLKKVKPEESKRENRDEETLLKPKQRVTTETNDKRRHCYRQLLEQ